MSECVGLKQQSFYLGVEAHGCCSLSFPSPAPGGWSACALCCLVVVEQYLKTGSGTGAQLVGYLPSMYEALLGPSISYYRHGGGRIKTENHP